MHEPHSLVLVLLLVNRFRIGNNFVLYQLNHSTIKFYIFLSLAVSFDSDAIVFINTMGATNLCDFYFYFSQSSLALFCNQTIQYYLVRLLCYFLKLNTFIYFNFNTFIICYYELVFFITVIEY